MPRVVHFEISADQPERAAEFYRKVFGWEINKWDGPVEYWLVMTGDKEKPGIDGGMMKRQENFPPVTNIIDVDSVDDFATKIAQSGGKIVVPKGAIPGVGWFAYFADTEGNISGIMQSDPEAK
jgi:predicted enzyme related to lactoylglutathione lyase